MPSILHFMRFVRVTLATLAALTIGPAAAHDTWFEPQARGGAAPPVLALGTGNRFPRHEFMITSALLQSSGCVDRGGRRVALQHVADEPTLWLRPAQSPAAAGALSCWARLVPLEVEIADATVQVYLDEIHALPAMRERWAILQARGVRWKETYVKHTRIELAASGAAAAAATAAGPLEALGVDAVIEGPARPLQAGDTMRAQVLRNGRPLAGMPVELQNNLLPLGIWRTTDAEGRISVTLPMAARWLLRGVDLRPSSKSPDEWESDFVSLAFEVLPATPRTSP